MFASLECMHYEWKNCLLMWQGTSQVRDDENFILLEAIADQSLWIWHAIFDLHGRSTNVNVLDHSRLVTNFLEGGSPRYVF